MRHQAGKMRFFGFDETHTERLPDQPEFEKKYRADLDEKRAALLSLPSQTDGLDLASIDRFWETQGLEVPPYIVIERDDVDKVKEILDDDLDIPGGVYKHRVDVAIAVREPKAEAVNGRGFMEGMIVHEQAHGTSNFFDYTFKANMENGQYYEWFHRRGFTTEAVHPRKIVAGQIYEEAFADRQRLKYLESIGLKNGHMRGVSSMLAIEVGGSDVSVPAKYAHLVGEGYPDFIPSELAAYALDLLIERMPGLAPRSMKARSSIVEIAKFAKTINRIQPGLFDELRALNYDFEGFTQGLLKVIHATGRSGELVRPTID